MADFKKSLLAGVDAAKIAKANREEILSVIAEVNKQLNEVYESKLNFGIYNLLRSIEPKTKNILNTAFSHLSLEREAYQALAVADPSGKNPAPLADWQFSENGYPCKIIRGGLSSYCNNKEELEAEISSLLSEVRTGKTILEKVSDYENKIKDE